MTGTFPPIEVAAPDAAQAAAQLRSLMRSTLPLCRALVAECCRAEKVDQRLATVLEDFGQEFIGLSYPINAAAYAQQALSRAGQKAAKLTVAQAGSRVRPRRTQSQPVPAQG